jgi:hypothetical protein
MHQFHRSLAEYCVARDIQHFYVTAFELACLVKQAERGLVVPDWDLLSWHA